MDKAITDKNFCVMLRGNYKTYLNESEAKFLSQSFEQGKEVVIINSKTFFKFGVLFILPAPEIDREDKVKRGAWKCKFGFWHEKNEECGHDLERIYNKTCKEK